MPGVIGLTATLTSPSQTPEQTLVAVTILTSYTQEASSQETS